MLAYLVKVIETFFWRGNLVDISVKCHQGKGQRGEIIVGRRGCPPRPRPGAQELSCIPETQQSQQAAGVEELVVGDPLEMSDTEQSDIALETQQDSDSSDEDIADTQTHKLHRLHRLHRLPQAIRTIENISGFRKQLKTYLFRLAYPPP